MISLAGAIGHAWPRSNWHSLMKIVLIIGCTLLLAAVGCKREARPAVPQPAGSKMVSDGQATWTLGAATINGTNVPLSNISVRVITNQTAK